MKGAKWGIYPPKSLYIKKTSWQTAGKNKNVKYINYSSLYSCWYSIQESQQAEVAELYSSHVIGKTGAACVRMVTVEP
jgi:hypothetical protein